MLIKSSSAFAAWVRSQRITSGLTQDELARRVGMSRRWVQQGEAGKVVPTLAASIRLAEGLGMELHLEPPQADELFEQIFAELE